MENIISKKPKLTLARIQLIITQDIFLRAPAWALLVAVLMGSVTFFFIWFVLNVIRPFVMTL